MPIELVDFTGKCNSRSVSLSWITATEKNNDHFIVERSYNGKDFEIAGTVKGAGNSAKSLNYNFTDNIIPQSALYYRLSQVDFNKPPKICKTIVVEGCGLTGKDITINNTNDGKVFIGFNADAATEYSVSLYNLLGQKVRSEIIKVNEGYDRQNLETSTLPEGYFLLLIQNADGDIQKKQKVYINNN